MKKYSKAELQEQWGAMILAKNTPEVSMNDFWDWLETDECPKDSWCEKGNHYHATPQQECEHE